jgi:hypothetical protein
VPDLADPAVIDEFEAMDNGKRITLRAFAECGNYGGGGGASDLLNLCPFRSGKCPERRPEADAVIEARLWHRVH